MSKANQKARVSSHLGIYTLRKQQVERERKACELNHSRDKQATRIYREVRSTLSNASLVSLYGSRVPIKNAE